MVSRWHCLSNQLVSYDERKILTKCRHGLRWPKDDRCANIWIPRKFAHTHATNKIGPASQSIRTHAFIFAILAFSMRQTSSMTCGKPNVIRINFHTHSFMRFFVLCVSWVLCSNHDVSRWRPKNRTSKQTDGVKLCSVCYSISCFAHGRCYNFAVDNLLQQSGVLLCEIDCIFNFPSKRDKARSIIIINCVAQESEIKCVRRCHRVLVQLFQKFTTMAISGLVFCHGRRAIFSSAFSFRSVFIVSISGGFSFLFFIIFEYNIRRWEDVFVHTKKNQLLRMLPLQAMLHAPCRIRRQPQRRENTNRRCLGDVFKLTWPSPPISEKRIESWKKLNAAAATTPECTDTNENLRQRKKKMVPSKTRAKIY